MNWLKPDNPYNVTAIKTFKTIHGDGFEATLRMYATKVGTVTSPNPLVPIVVQGLTNGNLTAFTVYIRNLGCTQEEFLRELIEAYWLEQEHTQKTATLSKAVESEKRKLWGMLSPDRTWYRLKGMAPGTWDYYGCGNSEIIRQYCKTMHGEINLECVLTSSLLEDPDWCPPYPVL